MVFYLRSLSILIVVLEDNLRLNYLQKRKKSLFKNILFSKLADHLVFDKHDLTSMKTSLYLFYIFALVFSHVLIINPYLEISESIRNYFVTVGYGIVLLIAVDKFLGQFLSDINRIKNYEGK